MINLVELKTAINKVLEPTGIPTIANDEKEGIEKYKPCFYVQIIIPTTSLSSSSIDTTVLAYIYYFPESKTDLECMKMADRLSTIFQEEILSVEGYILDIDNIRIEIQDNVLMYAFDIEYSVVFNPDKDTYEIMDNLELRR